MNDLTLLSVIIFLPAFGALGLCLPFFDKKNVEAMRYWSLLITVMTFVATLVLLTNFNPAEPGIQPIQESGERGVAVTWISNWNIYYRLGYDGISVPLVLLTSFICLLAMMASWNINKLVRGYLILFLLLETGMLGVFLSLDFFLFYVFWEVMLLPMYFLIGVWGGPRREYAAIKFFLFTLLGSVLMLIAILILYFNSDITSLKPQQLADARVLRPYEDPQLVGGQ